MRKNQTDINSSLINIYDSDDIYNFDDIRGSHWPNKPHKVGLHFGHFKKSLDKLEVRISRIRPAQPRCDEDKADLGKKWHKLKKGYHKDYSMPHWVLATF